MDEQMIIDAKDLLDHIDHKEWDMMIEDNVIYLMCNCGDQIAACDIPYWYSAGETAQDDDIKQGLG